MAEKQPPYRIIGRELGSFRIIQKIGSGVLGTVYLARETAQERDFALKIVSPQWSCHPSLMARYQTEAIALTHLNHPSLMTFHAFKEDREFNPKGPLFYFVMEYIEGITLKKRLMQNIPLHPPRALPLLAQLIEGLAYLHGKGFLHRDIKPSNLFITPAQQLKIADYGFSRIDGLPETPWGNTHSSPHYLAPEQIQGEVGDVRSDIYALGLTVYEMLTGTPFYDRNAGAAINPTHRPAPALAHEIIPEITPAMAHWLDKCIAYDPDKRYQSLEELSQAFSELHQPPASIQDTQLERPRYPWNHSILETPSRSRFNPSPTTLRRTATLLSLILAIMVLYLIAVTPFRSPAPPTQPSNRTLQSVPAKTPADLSLSTFTPATEAPPPSSGITPLPHRTSSLEMIRWIKQGRYQQIIETGQRAVAQGNDSGDLYQFMALAHFFQGNTNQSRQYLDKALKKNTQIHFELLYELTPRQFVSGQLIVTRRTLHFVSPHLSPNPLFNLSLTQVGQIAVEAEAPQDDRFVITLSPRLLIKDQQDKRYRLQLPQETPALAPFIILTIKTLKGE